MKITEKAASEIRKILESNGNSLETTYLRVGIAGVRCSGPVYSFTLDEEYNQEADDLVEQEGLKLISEKSYSQVLEPVIIDYAEVEDRKGFVFTNPLAVLSGGCGSGGCGSGGCSSH